jgi:hypothetical protein
MSGHAIWSAMMRHRFGSPIGLLEIAAKERRQVPHSKSSFAIYQA